MKEQITYSYLLFFNFYIISVKIRLESFSERGRRMKITLSKMTNGKVKFFAFPKSHLGSYLYLKEGMLYYHIRDFLTPRDMEEFTRDLIKKEVLLYDKSNRKYEFNPIHPLVIVQRVKNFIQVSLIRA